jgi:P-type conjugative transfer protein TrbJ
MTRHRFPRHAIRNTLLIGAAALFIAVSVPADAQMTVYDPLNHIQNVLTAARELQQVTNELTMLQNQATSLINQARNLQNLNFSSLSSIDQSLNQTTSLLGQAQRVSYDVTSVNSAFSQNYPASYSGSTSSSVLTSDAQTRWQNALAAYQDAMRVQAGVVQNLQTTHTQVDALVTASQSATGALQAAQSGNQLIALLTKQLADLTAVMTAIARAQSLEGARTVETQEQVQAQNTQFLNYGAGYTPGSAQMFH